MKDNDENQNGYENLDKLLAEADIEGIVDKGVRKKESFIRYLRSSFH